MRVTGTRVPIGWRHLILAVHRPRATADICFSQTGARDADDPDVPRESQLHTLLQCGGRRVMSRRKSLSSTWFDLALDSMALIQGSAVVIGQRTTTMGSAGSNPPAAQKREARRMVEEKVSASAESWTRAAFASAGVYQAMAMTAMFAGRPPSSTQLQRAAIKILGAAAAPYNTKVRRNVKRLRNK